MSVRIGAMLSEAVKNFFTKPATVQYPFEKLEIPKTLRGKPVMNPQLCAGCRMCERDCPSEAIAIHQISEAKDEQGKVKKSFLMIFYLDRCTHCALCETVCPRSAIAMDNSFEDAALNREALKIVYK